MFKLFKMLFSPKEEKTTKSVKEQKEEILLRKNSHKYIREILLEGSRDFDYKYFIKYVEESNYVSEYIREITLKRIKVIKPVYFLEDEMNNYLEKTVGYFIESEEMILNDTLEHLKYIEEMDKKIINSKNEIINHIKEAKSSISKANELISSLDDKLTIKGD